MTFPSMDKQSPGSTSAVLLNFKFLQNFIHSSMGGVDVLYTKYYNTKCTMQQMSNSTCADFCHCLNDRSVRVSLQWHVVDDENESCRWWWWDATSSVARHSCPDSHWDQGLYRGLGVNVLRNEMSKPKL